MKKNSKKLKTFEKTKNENFEQSHSAKNVKGALWAFSTSIQLQNIKKWKWDPLETLKNFEKCLKAGKSGGESLIEPKN